MRIYFTSLEENRNIKEIEKRIKNAFKDKDYSIVVVPSVYEKESEKIKEYHKEYYQKNRERLIQEQRDRREKQKIQKEIAIIEEYIGIPQKEVKKKKRQLER